ncbi:MAG: hypothetical protein OXC19_15455 [Bryobacterales bacterium]|nr:hypothetical protein [Bryobacterales bacterium]
MFESSDTIPILLAIIGVGGVLACMAWRMPARLVRCITEDRRAADADRRAFQRAMDDFRVEMRRLAERQSNVEGRFDAA